jgi:hypothetical protein
MGMPCEVNSIVKLKRGDGYPEGLGLAVRLGDRFTARKVGYRIFPMDVPLQLVDEAWLAHGDVIIRELTWAEGRTTIGAELVRLYEVPFSVK